MITFILHATHEYEGLIMPDIINRINDQYPNSKIIVIDQNYVLNLNDIKATILDLPNIKTNDTADWSIRFLNIWLGTEPKDDDILIRMDPDTILVSTVDLSKIYNKCVAGQFFDDKKVFQGSFQVFTPYSAKALIYPLKKLRGPLQDIMLYDAVQQLQLPRIDLEGLDLEALPKINDFKDSYIKDNNIKVYHPDKKIILARKKGKAFSSRSLEMYVTNRVQRLSA
jgi:hypothetical protein